MSLVHRRDGKPLDPVVRDRMKFVGFFVELVGDLARGVSIHDEPGGSRDYERGWLVAYLTAGVKIAATMGSAADPFNPQVFLTGVGSPLTDGEWIWPEELAYLVEQYNVALPEEFLAAVKRRRYQVPEVEKAQRREAWDSWSAQI